MTDDSAAEAEPRPETAPEPVLAAVRLVVGAAIVDDLARPARLLAARRTEPPALAGGWELPGGKVEPGESGCRSVWAPCCRARCPAPPGR